MYIVSETVARRSVTLADAISLMDEAFRAVVEGDAVAFPVLMCHGTQSNTRFGVKAALNRKAALPGLKIGSYWPDNSMRGIEAHGSTTILLDDETGFPVALVSAGHINGLRTAGADAVGVRALARPDASHVAIIGAGHQAWYDLKAIAEVRDVKRVSVWNRSPDKAAAFARRASDQGFDAQAVDLEQAVRGADIIVTATASQEPLVQKEWVSPGTHISAMGADARGKQELDPQLALGAALFAELPEQSVVLGEFQHAAALGLIGQDAVTPIGAVLNGSQTGRTSADQITIFDSSGIGVQDLAIAAFAVERARALDLGTEVDIG
ncbi:ornithine cyclodeaminase family protein [Sphingosinicella rhizophila]|uniref:Ornithine cyclodeaminase family protein n=1 Tax=Sphingosinicella rhizophila TaxID=3050082 RepID=A0ABU3QAR5_9SPHN|nr:ornithine cyclodeaminase family protein [Sphingosinicella sp. GR2756]MDT9600498.1 ornithine cyclodeaminase family protein [Sphingosinicella sp. GR2756]